MNENKITGVEILCDTKHKDIIAVYEDMPTLLADVLKEESEDYCEEIFNKMSKVNAFEADPPKQENETFKNYLINHMIDDDFNYFINDKNYVIYCRPFITK